MDSLSSLIEQLQTAEVFAIDTETTSKDPMRAQLVGLSFSITPDQAFYIPCAHDYPGSPEQLEIAEVLNRLKPVLENPGIKKSDKTLNTTGWFYFATA